MEVADNPDNVLLTTFESNCYHEVESEASHRDHNPHPADAAHPPPRPADFSSSQRQIEVQSTLLNKTVL